MDVMELGAIGEMVGGVAVIASLLFVGFEMIIGDPNVRQGFIQFVDAEIQRLHGEGV